MVNNLPANAGDVGSIRGSGRSPGEGNGNPFQYSCLENPMDRGAEWATFHRVTKESDTTEWLTHLCDLKCNELSLCLSFLVCKMGTFLELWIKYLEGAICD